MVDRSLIVLALETLSTLHHEEARYRHANKVLHDLDGDFPMRVKAASDTIATSVVKLLDATLGDEIASYFLYEANGMKNGGKIIETDGREWPIRSLDDAKAYVMREGAA